MIKCPECNNEFQGPSQFCINCGAEIPGMKYLKAFGITDEQIKNASMRQNNSSKKVSPAGAIIFFLLFFGMGSLFEYIIFIYPMGRCYEAKNWLETPCHIISSQVKSHHGSKGGNTYSVDMNFSYEFNNHKYISNRYDFTLGSSSGYDSKAAVVNNYPPGKDTLCYVNPAAPNEAVISRDIDKVLYFIALFPLIFIIIGLVGLVSSLKSLSSGR
jgi:hypothetical protein